MSRLLEIILELWLRFAKVTRKNMISNQSSCKCLLCNHLMKDTNELWSYIRKMEVIIEKQLEILEELDDLPENIPLLMTTEFEVKRAEAVNKINSMEAKK